MAQDPNQVSTAEIRSRIERTRVELGHTIDAIQDRLSPRRVMHDAKETISDATIGRAKRLAHRMTRGGERRQRVAERVSRPGQGAQQSNGDGADRNCHQRAVPRVHDTVAPADARAKPWWSRTVARDGKSRAVPDAAAAAADPYPSAFERRSPLRRRRF